MLNAEKPNYDFKNPIFKKVIKYKRWAREHMHLSEIDSEVILWEVKETATALQIPTKYHIHYKIKSIIGIDDEQNPILSSHHVMELTLPPGYPMEPCKIYMLTPTWHPNIKSEGVHKGRICGNVKNFGKAFDLYQMVLRVGEILQYKNYHAQHVPPYPEDSTVAHWVTNFAEPNGILDKSKEIYIDDTSLVRLKNNNTNTEEAKPEKVEPIVAKPPAPPVPQVKVIRETPKPAEPEMPKDTKPEEPKKVDEPKEVSRKVIRTIRVSPVRKNTSKIRLQIKKKNGGKNE